MSWKILEGRHRIWCPYWLEVAVGLQVEMDLGLWVDGSASQERSLMRINWR